MDASKVLLLPRKSWAEASELLWTCQFLTILTSKSLSRAGGVQILATWPSKSSPKPSSFNNFDFQIALARRLGANFRDILGSRSSATPVFRSWLSEPAKPQNYGEKHSISRNSYPPKPHVTHLCCITSARSRLLVDRSSAATLSIVES